MLLFAICCMSMISGKTRASPARASEPNWPTKCASTLVVTAINTTFTTRFGAASRSSVEAMGPSRIRRVRAAPGFWAESAGATSYRCATAHLVSVSLSGSVGRPSARQVPMPPARATASMPRSRSFAAQSPPISKPQAQ